MTTLTKVKQTGDDARDRVLATAPEKQTGDDARETVLATAPGLLLDCTPLGLLYLLWPLQGLK